MSADNNNTDQEDEQRPAVVESPLAPYLRMIGIKLPTPAQPDTDTTPENPSDQPIKTTSGSVPSTRERTAGTKTAPHQKTGKISRPQKNDKPRKKPKTDRQKKREKILYIVLGVLAFIALVVWWGFQRPKGTIHHSICTIFAEQQLPYPYTMQVRSTDGYGNKVRIFYTSIDPFGEYKMDRIECTFDKNAQGGKAYSLKEVRVNKIEFDAETLRRFNASIPAILADPPVFYLPPKPSTGIEDLKRYQ